MMIAVVAAAAVLGCAQPASAGLFTDTLTRCLVTKATPEDKQDFVIWVFASIGSHPAVKGYVRMTEADNVRISREAAQVMQRLIVQDCRKETQEAIKYEGSEAMKAAFEVLGGVAMTDLISDPEVAKSMEGFASHLDEKALQAMMAEASVPAK